MFLNLSNIMTESILNITFSIYETMINFKQRAIIGIILPVLQIAKEMV